MRYKREKSCSRNGIQSFIDQLNMGVKSQNIELKDLKKNILDRLKLCINDRLYEQQFFIDNNHDDYIQDHLNIIKVYYDFYVKLEKYFFLLNILITSDEVRIIKQENKGNFNHSIALELKNKDIVQFTDVLQDTSYLNDLDFSKNFHVSQNENLLNQNIPDWLENDKIYFFIKYIENLLEDKKQEEERKRKQEEELRIKQEMKLSKQMERYMLGRLSRTKSKI
jgi:hypothetical protein